MLFLVLLFLSSALIIVFCRNKNSDYWKKRNIVQQDGLLSEFVFGNRALAEVYKDIYDRHPTKPYVGFFIGTRPALLLRDTENIQAVLATEFNNFYQRGIVIHPEDTLANNVLFMDDFLRWKILRQKLSPVFTTAKLKNMFYILDRCAKDFTERIRENPKIVDDPFDSLYTYTTASIGASIFGIDIQTKNTMDSPFLDMAKNAVQPSLRQSLIFAIGNLSPSLLKILNLKIFGQYEDFFVGVVRKVIESRRNNKEKRNDFIDMCIELQDQGTMKDGKTGFELEPTVEVLAAQAFFFFVAGSDTSAGTMHFTLLELSNNPSILKTVHDEIDKVFQNNDDKLNFEDIDKLQFLEMVVNEAIRKYPPIGLIQRKCTKDTILPVGGLKVEKDCLVLIPVYAVHRDESHYPNSDTFDPERFSPENVQSIPKFAYMPFGEGNRICLGMRFARLQVLAGLAWLLRRFTLRPQNVTPKRFEPSVFALRAPHARFDLVPRSLTP
ncbi:hypothetical protein O0L34_g8379 [Tuta absoluta]|nr:hypothetical protein O0L34_g8379 [Tuta absoluta]